MSAIAGQAVMASIVLKPMSSILLPGRTIDIHGNEVEVITKESSLRGYLTKTPVLSQRILTTYLKRKSLRKGQLSGSS
jgi:chorismate synthase